MSGKWMLYSSSPAAFRREKNTDIETQFEMDTINAVPTPRFEVGDVLLAAQPLGNTM